MIHSFDSVPYILSRFIALEGLDGSGTTTQLTRLASRFKEKGLPCRTTCEPSDGPIGSLIRDILSGKKKVDPYTLAFLFAGDRNEHLLRDDSGILKQLASGDYVITDRYLFSSLAYQSVECGYPFVLTLNRYFPLPEHLFFIDVPVDLGQKRLADRDGRDIFDRVKTQKAVKALYERSFNDYRDKGMQFHRIDGSLEIEEITDKMWHIILPS